MKTTSILSMTAICMLYLTSSLSAQSSAELEAARRLLVEEAIVGGGIKDERVIKSIRETPRHEFIDRKYRRQAYLDMALPIGDKQTISSPFIVAFMTESLSPTESDRVLEIGTGSGYQAAVLSPLVREVYSIEIVESLGRHAKETLKRLKYDNVHVRVGDGYKGWPEKAPFDKIIVTCSPERIPTPLVEQLKEGGLMIVPVGERYQQTLYLTKKKDGKMATAALRPTLFVPMTGAAEDKREVQPDPDNPEILNGGFDEPLPKNGFVNGWYYQRNLKHIKHAKSPIGEYHVSFTNEHVGAPAHLLQGLAINGKKVQQIELSAWIKSDNVQPGRDSTEQPVVAITFYDPNRKDLGTRWLGPFRGTNEWHQQSKRFPVPLKTQEAIIRIGLFGATGTIAFDGIKLKVVNE